MVFGLQEFLICLLATCLATGMVVMAIDLFEED